MNRQRTMKIVYIAMLAAVATVLMYLEFALPIFPAFLKFDFSDMPALVASFAFGPVAGVAVELVKNLLHLPATATAGVGELANFLVGSAMVVTAGLVYKRRHILRGALLGMLGGTVAMMLAGGLCNYFITIPFFSATIAPMEAILGMASKIIPAVTDKLTLVLYTFTPFNLLKGVVISLITLLVYKRIRFLFERMSHRPSRKA